LTPVTPLKDALPVLEQDLRFKNMAKEDLVDEYLSFLDEFKQETLENYERFLKECPYLSSITPTEGEEYIELLVKLNRDVRFRRMAFDEPTRDAMIRERIEYLKAENKKKYGDAEGVFEAEEEEVDEKFK